MIFNRFPVEIVIFEERGGDGQYFKILDNAKRVNRKDTGEHYYELKKKKVRIPPVPYDNIYMIENGKKTRQVVFLYSLTPSTFIPLKLSPNIAKELYNGQMTKEIIESIIPKKLKESFERDENKKLDVNVDDKWLYWASQQVKQNVYRTQYKSFIEKIMPIALVLVTGLMIGLILYMSLGQLTVVSQLYAQSSTQMVEVTKNLALASQNCLCATPQTSGVPPF